MAISSLGETLVAEGTISTSGDNIVIPARPGARIIISKLLIQNNSVPTTTAIYKSGTTNKGRVLMQSLGDGINEMRDGSPDLRLGANEPFVINLSAANSTIYTVEYGLEPC